MLLPEGGLIDRLIVALEEASGDNRLSDDEHLLLSRLQKLKGDLEVMRLERLVRLERHRAAARASQRAGPGTDPPAGPRPSPLKQLEPALDQRKHRAGHCSRAGLSLRAAADALSRLAASVRCVPIP